jgi:ribosomal protein S18 acetylase RimI-like enzyme
MIPCLHPLAGPHNSGAAVHEPQIPMTDTASRRVRSATLDDLGAILAIEEAAFDPVRRSSTAAIRRALKSHFQRVLVLEIAGLVVGYVILWPHRRVWRIYNLAAHPGYRNQGIGGALLAIASEHAERAGAQRLVLESRDEPALLRFYQQRGFRSSRRLPDYYAPGEHALRLELPLPRTPVA